MKTDPEVFNKLDALLEAFQKEIILARQAIDAVKNEQDLEALQDAVINAYQKLGKDLHKLGNALNSVVLREYLRQKKLLSSP